jgi:outer membrane protein
MNVKLILSYTQKFFLKFFLLAFAIFIFEPASALTLDEAFRSALQKNEVSGQSRERVNQAEELIDQAKGAAYPSLFLNATHLTQPAPSDPVARAFFPEQQTTANLTLNVPLFRGFREYSVLRQRNDLYSSERQQRIATLLLLYEQVATSYLEVLAHEQDLKNLNEQRTLYGQRVKELQGRIRRGESNSTEALIAQSTEAAVEAEIRIVQSRLKSARETFSFLTTAPAESPLSEEIVNKPDSGLRPIGEYLAKIEERPDIKGAKDRVSATSEEVTFAKGSHWPTLDAVGNYYLKRPDGFLSDVKWDVQVRFSLPIFEGGLRVSQTQEASSKLRESELELSKLRRRAAADIRSLHEGLKMRQDQLAALKRSTELAEKTYQVVQRDYRRGLTRNIDVQLAMTEYRVSRRMYDQARYSARLELIKLETAAAILPLAITKDILQ